MTTIQLGSVVFNGFATSGWVFSGLTDWFGQVDNKVPVTQRPQAHGAFSVSRALRSSRAVSFNAAYLGDDSVEVESAVDELAAVGADGPVLMTVTTDAGVSWRWVTVETSSFADNHGMSHGLVAVDCVARDPRRYEDAPWLVTGPPAAGLGLVWPVIWPAVWPGGGSSGRIDLVNRGRASSAPVFRLTGGFESAVITNTLTGARIGFGRALPPTSTVVIDVAERRAVIDGQSDVSRFLQWREWSEVPAGMTVPYQFDVSGAVGSPTLEGRVCSAWW